MNSVQVNRHNRREWLKKSIEALPQNLQQKGWEMAACLDEAKLHVTADGKYIPPGKTEGIPRSNIVDLIAHSIEKGLRKKQPVGYEAFYLKTLSLFKFHATIPKVHPSM